MKQEQNPLVAITNLEEMAAQLMLQDFVIAPNQLLIQFLSILPDSEYEVEKRTFSNGQQLEREQVLLAIRTRYQNLQRQRRKSGGRRDGGHAFVADARGAESSAAAKISSRAPAGGVVGRVEVEVEVVEGGGRNRRTSRATGRRKRKMEAADQTRRPQA